MIKIYKSSTINIEFITFFIVKIREILLYEIYISNLKH